MVRLVTVADRVVAWVSMVVGVPVAVVPAYWLMR